MKHFKTEGIVIRRRNFREADRILTIYTKAHGKIQVKAIGVRRITSRRSSHTEPLNNCIFGLYQGRQLPIVTEVQSLENFSGIKSDLQKVGLAYHLCELIDGLCAENQENYGVFSLLKTTFQKLEQEGTDLSLLIFDFEKQLLRLLGFYSNQQVLEAIDTTSFIENILERKLKSRQFLHRLI